MALMKGRWDTGFLIAPERRYDFELTPVLPSPDGPRDAYSVRVWRTDEPVFAQTSSVATFTGGHYDLWQLSNALRHAPDLLEAYGRRVVPVVAAAVD